MGNIIRAEVSEKNPYWIEKHRHYELKHFCLQYPIWKKAYSSLNGMLSRREALNAFGKARHVSNPNELKKLGELLDIPFVDSIILGDGIYISFMEKGIL